MPYQPLAEVFGFPVDNLSPKAERFRTHRLCPYNNRVANCTKDKANDPLGVCSVFDTAGNIAITCPIRFRQDWTVAEDAADFFFDSGEKWTSLAEVRLNDRNGLSAGNIDLVLVAYDDRGRVTNFGSLEVQAVYISGNVRKPFEQFIQNRTAYLSTDWESLASRPRPDYLSSSRKRLVPQLIYKGGILKSWGKKQAVALHRGFYETLPVMAEFEPSQADIVWLIYDLVLNESANQYELTLTRKAHTLFKPALDRIVTPEPGVVESFIDELQIKLDAKLDGEENPPDAPTLADLL